VFDELLLSRTDNVLLSGVWPSLDHRVKAGTKQSATVGESGGGGGHWTAARSSGWSLTLAGSATGRPADWAIVEAKLAPELKGSRQEIIQRAIEDTTVAHLNTTNHSAELVQRGFELYRAINGSNSVSCGCSMLNSTELYLLDNNKPEYYYYYYYYYYHCTD